LTEFETVKKMVKKITDLAYCLKHFLLVGVHLRERANLRQVDVLTVTQCNYLIECKYKWKRLRYDFRFFNIFTILRNLFTHNDATET